MGKVGLYGAGLAVRRFVIASAIFSAVNLRAAAEPGPVACSKVSAFFTQAVTAPGNWAATSWHMASSPCARINGTFQ